MQTPFPWGNILSVIVSIDLSLYICPYVYICSCWLHTAWSVNVITSGCNVFLLCVERFYKIDNGAVLSHSRL